MIANAVYKFHTKKLEVKALTTAPTLWRSYATDGTIIRQKTKTLRYLEGGVTSHTDKNTNTERWIMNDTRRGVGRIKTRPSWRRGRSARWFSGSIGNNNIAAVRDDCVHAVMQCPAACGQLCPSTRARIQALRCLSAGAYFFTISSCTYRSTSQHVVFFVAIMHVIHICTYCLT